MIPDPFQRYFFDTLHLQKTSEAKPLFFFAIERNQISVLDAFKTAKVDFSLNAYRTQVEIMDNELGSNFKWYRLDKDHPISAFQHAILAGHPEMLKYVSRELGLTQSGSKVFLTFAVNNKAPAASINWLLEQGAVLDPTEIRIEDIVENGYTQLLIPFSRQESFNVNLSQVFRYLQSLFSLALGRQQFAMAIALIDLKPEIANDISENVLLDQNFIGNLMRLVKAPQLISSKVLNALIPTIKCTQALKLAFECLDFKKNPDATGNQFFHLLAQSHIFGKFFNEIASDSYVSYDLRYVQALLTPNARGQMPIHIFFQAVSDLQNMHEIVELHDYLQNLLMPKSLRQRPNHTSVNPPDLQEHIKFNEHCEMRQSLATKEFSKNNLHDYG